jgi:hypothetical protein
VKPPSDALFRPDDGTICRNIYIFKGDSSSSALMIFLDKDYFLTSSYHQKIRQKDGIFVKRRSSILAAFSFNKICLTEVILPKYTYMNIYVLFRDTN